MAFQSKKVPGALTQNGLLQRKIIGQKGAIQQVRALGRDGDQTCA